MNGLIVGVKTCSVCDRSKPLSEFYRSKRNLDGFASCCKTCERARKRLARANNPERFRDRNRRYREANPEKEKARRKVYRDKNKIVLLEKKREWRKANPEKVKDSNRRLYRVNAAVLRERRQQYYQDNKERIEATRRRNYPLVAEKVQARNTVSQAIRNGLLPKPSELPCAICGDQGKQYHHESYEKEHRLDVIAVCDPCHGILHRDS